MIVPIFYSIFVLSVGVLGFAYLMTGFSNFVSGTFTEEFGFFENHSKILSFMGSHKAPRDLVKSALQFLSFRRHQRSLAIQPHVLVEAPEALRSDLRMFANKRIVENSALLCNLDPALIASVISRCEIRLYMPGQQVFRFGNACSHLYFVREGIF